MTAEADLGKLLTYVQTHRSAGHNVPRHPKFEDYLTDLDTLARDAHRVRYAYHPPATEAEQLSFLVSTVGAMSPRTETLVANTDALAAKLADVAADVADVRKLADSVNTLVARVAELEAGDVLTQSQVDALTTTAGDIDTAIDAITTPPPA